jgi:hypothetical protein
MNAKQKERQEAIERLKEWIKPGDTLYLVLRHRSASGMSRTISVKGFRVRECDGTIDDFEYSYNVALALGWRFNRDREGVTVGGCGMDMGFHLVYELSGVLFGDGYTLKHRWL